MKDEKSLKEMINKTLRRKPKEISIKKIRKNNIKMAKMPITKEGHKI